MDANWSVPRFSGLRHPSCPPLDSFTPHRVLRIAALIGRLMFGEATHMMG